MIYWPRMDWLDALTAALTAFARLSHASLREAEFDAAVRNCRRGTVGWDSGCDDTMRMVIEYEAFPWRSGR